MDLALLGMYQGYQKKYSDAEPNLRECLAIREKTQPDDWKTFNTKSMLGGALLGQKKYVEAEPLLLAGYEGMKQRAKTIPPQASPRIPEALDRLMRRVALFDEETTGYASRVAPVRIDSDGDYDHLARVKEWSLSGWSGE